MLDCQPGGAGPTRPVREVHMEFDYLIAAGVLVGHCGH